MPDAVKITELPEISTLARGDILPVVDESQTQTSRATLGQIKDMQAGANSVVTDSLANGAVTPPKTGFTGQFKIAASNDSSPETVAGTFVGQELDCSAYIQGLFGMSDGPAARAYLDALQSTDNPTFTGQVRFADGTNLAPSVTNFDDLRTGIYWPDQNTVGITTDGLQVVRFSPSGFRTTVTNYTTLLPHDGVRAWIVFDGTVGGSFTLANPHEIGHRLGLWPNTLLWDAATRAKLTEVEAARGLAVSGLSTVRDDGRSNYTSPGDNVHYAWNASTNSWYTVPASGQQWIGRATFTASGTAHIRASSNVAAVEAITSPDIGYRIHLLEPMPTTNYAVAATGNNLSYATAWTRAATYFDVRCLVVSGGGLANSSSDYISAAILL